MMKAVNKACTECFVGIYPVILILIQCVVLNDVHIGFVFCPFLQEMKFHGVSMAGPAKAMQRVGASGKWTSNMQRDMFRKVCKVVPCFKYVKCEFID